MSFTTASPSIVRSVVQRNMLNSWLHLFSREHAIPAFHEYRFERIEEERPDMVMCAVVWRDDSPRFRMSQQGPRMAEAFGAIVENADLEDFVGAELAPLVMPLYYECLSRGRPVYSSCLVKDTSGRIVTYERLLLPFGAGLRIETVLGSFKAISEEGAFEIRDLMRPGEAPVFLQRAVIDTGLALNRIAKQMDADVIEI